jgi:hypothetical protein
MSCVDWDFLDYDKPCEVLAALRPAFFKLLAGEREIWIKYKDRETRFTGDQIKVSELKAVIDILEQRCAAAAAAATGSRARYAIAAGYRR